MSTEDAVITAGMPAADGAQRATLRRTIITSIVGQALEWYDFFLYGTAAALIFGKLFFPIGTDPLVGTLAAFGGFAVGFVARPLGGVVCGHLGDRYGRKLVLVLTLVVMGVATTAMGLLPTYQQIGIWAPVLLVSLRFLQGLAAGGEWSGSILIISENAPPARRGFLSAWSPSGATIGFVLSAAAFWAVQKLPADDFMAWGWRVPFLASMVLVVAGYYIRSRIPESAEFVAARRSGHGVRMPVVEVLRKQPKQILMLVGLRMAEGGASYIFFAFSLAYGAYRGIPNQVMLEGLTISMMIVTVTALFYGRLSDRLGRRTVYMAGAIGLMLVAFPFFWLIDTREPSLVLLAYVLADSVVLAAMVGVQPSYMAELFKTEVRYSGMGIGRELSSVIGGGIAPMIATALLAKYHSSTPVAIYLILLGLVTVVALLFTPETRPREARRADLA
ncbi:Major Facilitator Superfamily protein [Cupriavidus taiwanensis]|uniref:MFS transporter n=1 Tax=Cupriavidus taiwanensis TaxID=164546 RepID=UPI000E1922CA|nr:MFS transporter [Cupriavidus taiwanensis]SOZ14974.1 Major Facilitator Superfamily protein [Cupriavidus taiwanensis]SOZ26827.1 Major Facilitator Superfamily protein [Cupriavidus taiwanensis]SOZ45547.1 Major Facilitator Superfamily protein [Cupriavidus taiwanensis]